MKTIVVDLDVYSKLWASRKSDEQSENSILRRILGITNSIDEHKMQNITSKVITSTNPAEWREIIYSSLIVLGRKSTLANLYKHIKQNYADKLTDEYEATIRGTLERYSSDSKNYRGGPDIFIHLGRGFWGIR